MIEFKSDSLSQLRPFFESLDELDVLGTIHRFPIIVDRCVIISDLIWLTKHRNKTGARTSLQESVHAGTLILFAPNELEEEVSSKFQRISKDEGISLQAIIMAWKDYQKYIQFINIEASTQTEIENAQDPKDLPFKKLQEMTGYPIYTQDSDISAMGGQVIKRKAIDYSRDYSRSAAVEYTLKYFGLFTIASAFVLFKFIWVGTISIINLIKQAPGWLQFGGLMILMVLFINKNSNQYIKRAAKKRVFGIKKISSLFLEYTASLFVNFKKSQEKATISLNHIKQEIQND